MARNVDGPGLAAAAAGSLLLYAGIKGYSVPHALQAFVQGQPPSGPPQYPIRPAPAAGGSGTSGGGSSAAAADFLSYAGRVPYVWGKASPAGWDCSGSCNYVLCHDEGLPIPGYAGGSFDGSQHGPATFTWLSWALAGHLTRISRAQVQSGDIVLWWTHMGVAIDNQTYISAQDPQAGTAQASIDAGGPAGEIPTFWTYGAAGQDPGILRGPGGHT